MSGKVGRPAGYQYSVVRPNRVKTALSEEELALVKSALNGRKMAEFLREAAIESAKSIVEGKQTKEDNMKRINFAIIQTGYAVFGVGETREQAIADAANWLEDENGVQGGLTEEQVEDLIQIHPNSGDFTILRAGYEDEDLDMYLENQGGYVKHDDGRWYDEDAE